MLDKGSDSKNKRGNVLIHVILRRLRAVSGTHSGFVFVALSIHHAMRLLHIVGCGLPKSTIFFHVVS